MDIKTKELSRKHIEHLLTIGYSLDIDMKDMIDAPYVLIKGNKLESCFSVNAFNSFSGDLKTKEQVLKLRPEEEKAKIKTLDKKEQKLHELLRLLNTQKNSKITGYDVSWSIQERKYDKGRYEIFPISPHACGSISMEHLEIILDFAKKHPYLYPSLSYTNYNQNKERYGTSTPCIYFY